jgi:hypothetical protein
MRLLDHLVGMRGNAAHRLSRRAVPEELLDEAAADRCQRENLLADQVWEATLGLGSAGHLSGPRQCLPRIGFGTAAAYDVTHARFAVVLGSVFASKTPRHCEAEVRLAAANVWNFSG